MGTGIKRGYPGGGTGGAPDKRRPAPGTLACVYLSPGINKHRRPANAAEDSAPPEKQPRGSGRGQLQRCFVSVTRSPAFASIPGPENDTQEGMKTDLPLSPLLSVCFSVREIQRFAGNVFNRASHTALRDTEGRKFCPQPRGRETEGRKEDRRSHSPCPPALHGQPQCLRRSGVSEPVL